MLAKSLRVAIIGAGFIGTDLLLKIGRSDTLTCALVVGRNPKAAGLRQAANLGYPTSDRGIAALLEEPDAFDLVFDATDALSHEDHWRRLERLGKSMINLTPSRTGHMVAPTVNGADALAYRNVSLISCGGQASVPLVHALARVFPRIPYLEVVTTVASRSVGRGTRMNLDEYIETTAAAVQAFSGAGQVKVLVNLSPARPPATFRVAISMMTGGAGGARVGSAVEQAAEAVRGFCPGYRIAACETFADGRIFTAVEVASRGDHLPVYAGNLDIINDAAIVIAERQARAAVARPLSAAV